MQSLVDLCWLAIIVIGSGAALRRITHTATPHVLGALVCASFLLFPIISWDDDVLWAKASDSEAEEAGTVISAVQKKSVVTPVGFRWEVAARAVTLEGTCLGVAVGACAPSAPKRVSLPHLRFPPLGQRPPPPG